MKVGSLIECINGNFSPENYKFVPNRPVKGEHYIVREIRDRGSNVGILLEEITNPPLKNKIGVPFEPTFKAERFREIEGLDEAIEMLLEENAFATAD